MSSCDEIKPGDHVAWNWGNASPSGVVQEVVPDRLELETKGGKTVTRKGDEENPALSIKNDKNGVPVAKKASEVEVIDEGEGHDTTEKVHTDRQDRLAAGEE